MVSEKVVFERVRSLIFDILRDDLPYGLMQQAVREARIITEENEVKYDDDSKPLADLSAHEARKLLDVK